MSFVAGFKKISWIFSFLFVVSAFVWAEQGALQKSDFSKKLRTRFECSSLRCTWGIIGDAGFRNSKHVAVRNSLMRSGVQQLILPGDNIYNPLETYESVWEPWRSLGFIFSVVALGNHHNGYENEIRYFDMPAEFYEKTVGPAHFIVLNSDNRNNVSEQALFLEKALSQASEENFNFLVMHHPLVTLTRRHSWQERREFHQKTLEPILKNRHKITAILSGHDHIATLALVEEIPLIVSGAVFESIPTSPTRGSDRGLNAQTLWLYREGYYWVRMDVDRELNYVWLNFVRADREEVSCSARIFPKPVTLRRNCRSSGLTKSIF